MLYLSCSGFFFLAGVLFQPLTAHLSNYEEGPMLDVGTREKGREVVLRSLSFFFSWWE